MQRRPAIFAKLVTIHDIRFCHVGGEIDSLQLLVFASVVRYKGYVPFRGCTSFFTKKAYEAMHLSRQVLELVINRFQFECKGSERNISGIFRFRSEQYITTNTSSNLRFILQSNFSLRTPLL